MFIRRRLPVAGLLLCLGLSSARALSVEQMVGRLTRLLRRAVENQEPVRALAHLERLRKLPGGLRPDHRRIEARVLGEAERSGPSATMVPASEDPEEWRWDVEVLARHLHQVAARRDGVAALALARWYLEGRKVTAPDAAARWCLRGRRWGADSAWTRRTMAGMRSTPGGFEYLPERSARYSRRMARLGDREEQYEAGRNYLLGRGVEADAGLARGWFEKAAAQGHAGARRELAKMPLEEASGSSP
jgi:TPR repeat protein